MKQNILLSIVSAILIYGTSFANNLQITNISKVSNTELSFQISWDNSWRVGNAPFNWDAAWVFIKAQDCDASVKAWEHVSVSTSSGQHSAGSGLQVDAVPDGMGVFIRRDNEGTGTIAPTTINIRLQNSYGASWIFEVMGIEMVAVMQGDFQTGGVGATQNGFEKVKIMSEAPIAASALYNGTNANSRNAALPADFPKGYNRFYIMKYEITQEQYVRFLNLLSFKQQVARTQNYPISPVGTNALAPTPAGGSATTVYNRNGVKVMQPIDDIATPTVYESNLNNNGTFGEAADGQNIACNFLKWNDLLAYLDWAALRPMTELEYEKASRGPVPVFADEYAWGNPNLIPATSNALTDPGQNAEVSNASVSTGFGLTAVKGAGTNPTDPLRSGFAATAISTRENAGASYWGVLDLTGNVWEQTVSVGYNNANVSAYTGILGDGELDDFGEADQSGWDLNPTYSVVRGGSWNSAANYVAGGGAYCTPTGSTPSSYFLRRFVLNNLNSGITTGTVYSDFTSTVSPANLIAGNAYTASIYSGYNGTTRHNYAIWIDYNDDGDFDDPGEKVVWNSVVSGSINHYSSPLTTASFTIPNISGLYRMRVQYASRNSTSTSYFGSNMSPCTTIDNSYTETEDYLVAIGNVGQTSEHAKVGSRYNIGNTNYTLNRHAETGGRGVRQF